MAHLFDDIKFVSCANAQQWMMSLCQYTCYLKEEQGYIITVAYDVILSKLPNKKRN
jgi:hypothetical protein